MPINRDADEIEHFVEMIADQRRRMRPAECVALMEGTLGIVGFKTYMAPSGSWWPRLSGWVVKVTADGEPWRSKAQGKLYYDRGPKMKRDGKWMNRSQVILAFRAELEQEVEDESDD